MKNLNYKTIDLNKSYNFVYHRPSSYERTMNCWRYAVKGRTILLNFRSKYCIDYLSIKVIPNEKCLNYKVEDLNNK
jgi:hypothetical protein